MRRDNTMNHILEEMLDILDGSSLTHYGILRRSGRYPWGSGGDPYQRSNTDFLGRIDELKKNGWTENAENVKKEFGCSLNQYRTKKAIASAERDNLNLARVKSLKKDGLNTSEIAREMGVNESTIRGWFKEEHVARNNAARNTADFIKKRIDETGKMIDVGKGVELELNVSREKLDQALKLLQEEGYELHGARVPQPTNKGQMTTTKLICPPGTPHKSAYTDFDNMTSLKEYVSHDGGETFDTFVYPKSMDSKRLKIRYNEEGGIEKDGIVEIRRGVEDLSLGNSRYAQVRILVDNTHYIKGMAVYSDDMPDGVDIVFNTNKTVGTDKYKVLKEIKQDPDNPFGSLIKQAGGQSYYIDKDGKRQLSLINKTREEGDWDEWQDALPSQFLSKQSLPMAKKQLKLAIDDKNEQFESICSLENPTIKKHYLDKFAEDCDSAAVKLQAAALPGQKHHVIIPISSMKDTEVYAPGYEDGTKLALVRYPHGGIFEIPVLTVNNKQPTAKKLLGTDIVDAVGINSKVAEQLSGADFDGDTVMCIPTDDRMGKVKVSRRPPLKGLEGFDPKMAYPEEKDMRYMGKTQMQKEMGVISNLITDMTLKGANEAELAAAVRHSMVVIDAYKHKLNYKKSEVDNNITALKKKYQIHRDENGNIIKTGGASTLISLAKSEYSVVKRQGIPKPNIKGEKWYDPNRPEGALIYQRSKLADYEYTTTNKKTGEVKVVTGTRKQQSTRMAETDDARTLISDYNTKMEQYYADYANSLKNLANQARIESWNTKEIGESKSAKSAYKNEVESLNAKLRLATLNNPRERLAIYKANSTIAKKKDADPNLSKEDLRKISQQSMTKSRSEVGAIARRKRNIDITDREWEAIQAGAIGHTKLKQILNNTDVDKLRDRAMPRRNTNVLTKAQITRARSLSASNYTLKEIAKKLGVSTSTVSKYLKGEK